MAVEGDRRDEYGGDERGEDLWCDGSRQESDHHAFEGELGSGVGVQGLTALDDGIDATQRRLRGPHPRDGGDVVGDVSVDELGAGSALEGNHVAAERQAGR